MSSRRNWEALGNLGVALILVTVGVQALRWLMSPPLDASAVRYSLVVAELILGFGIALGIVGVTVVRYRRTARE
jgi:hypothetical protein